MNKEQIPLNQRHSSPLKSAASRVRSAISLYHNPEAEGGTQQSVSMSGLRAYYKERSSLFDFFIASSML